jgi:hypothetical protein
LVRAAGSCFPMAGVFAYSKPRLFDQRPTLRCPILVSYQQQTTKFYNGSISFLVKYIVIQ